MKKLIAVVLLMMVCGSCLAESYSLTNEEQQFLLAVLSQAQIRGNAAPMLLQVVQALQKPIVPEPKAPIVPEPKAPEAK